MDLYFAPLACSLATRIALYEAGAQARYIQVDTLTKQLAEGGDFFAVNALGQVPVLREDDGETVLKPGDAAAWKAGVANGHCLINRSDRDAVFIEVGTRAPNERAYYSDIDMKVERDDKGIRYTKKNGEPY